MPNTLRRAALALALAAAPAAGFAQESQDPGDRPDLKVTETHGSWQMLCSEAGECSMQQIAKGPGGADFLLARINKIEPRQVQNETVDAIIHLLVPLRVMLPPGLGLKIDNGQVQRAPFSYCQPSGCVVQTSMPPALVNSMKKGVSAKVTVVVPPNQTVETELSLSGFTKAYNELTPMK